jgi:hypothetical protein
MIRSHNEHLQWPEVPPVSDRVESYRSVHTLAPHPVAPPLGETKETLFKVTQTKTGIEVEEYNDDHNAIGLLFPMFALIGAMIFWFFIIPWIIKMVKALGGWE